jgi:AraC-like DNA-binding protein
MSILFPGVAESLNIRLLSAGYITLDSWWTETDRLREFWRLYLNYQSGASLRVADEICTLPQDRIVLVPAGIDFRAELEHPVDQLFIQFEFVGWPAQAAREVVPTPVVLDQDAQRDALAEALRGELQSAHEIGPILASRLKALAHLAAAEVLSDIPEDRARNFLRIAEGQQELLAVLHYIDKHLDQPLNNARLAEIALASESRFIRRFREATGRTPGRYVQDRRLRRAAELLVSTDQTIDQIAESCGFANRYYFTRVFAQRMGCPPARYRSDRPYLHSSHVGAA